MSTRLSLGTLFPLVSLAVSGCGPEIQFAGVPAAPVEEPASEPQAAGAGEVKDSARTVADSEDATAASSRAGEDPVILTPASAVLEVPVEEAPVPQVAHASEPAEEKLREFLGSSLPLEPMQPDLSCGDLAHNASESRVRYRTAAVGYGQMCISETQERKCYLGQLSPWSGSFEHEGCTVEPPANCGDVMHGGTVDRVRYAESSVGYGGTCAKETQVAVCRNGILGAFSGTFASETCVVDEPLSCGSVANGETETRAVLYAAPEVPYGSQCSRLEQTRVCQNGIFSGWSAVEGFETCAVAKPSDCGALAHGATESRIRYQYEVAPKGQLCARETQQQTCTNGQLSGFSGTFTAVNCVEPEPVPFGANCTDNSTIIGQVLDMKKIPGLSLQRLPDFDAYPVQTHTCPNKFAAVNPDGSALHFTAGFPGLPGLYEWFAIRFITRILVPADGDVEFRLTSDDGSKLRINGAVIIDNDGEHSITAKTGSVSLTQGYHDMVLEYFQGPAKHIALRLEWRMNPSEPWQVVPMEAFEQPAAAIIQQALDQEKSRSSSN